MEINNIEKEQLIKGLIRDNLVNTHLVLGLNGIGLSASDYFLRLDESIFFLLDIGKAGKRDRLFKRFWKLCDSVSEINIQNAEELDQLTKNIYSELISMSTTGN